MTDFHGQLERQLVDAGRRRAQRGRWRAALAGRGRPLLAMATVLLAAVAVAASISVLGSASPSSAPGGGGGPPAPAGATATTAPGTTTTAPPDTTGSRTVTATPMPGYVPLPARPLRGTQVAILNGTTITGLAREAGDQLEAQGATLDTIGSALDQTRAQTVVGHRPGAGAQARLVATILGVSDIRPLTDAEAVLAPRADVVVQVGADRDKG